MSSQEDDRRDQILKRMLKTPPVRQSPAAGKKASVQMSQKRSRKSSKPGARKAKS